MGQAGAAGHASPPPCALSLQRRTVSLHSVAAASRCWHCRSLVALRHCLSVVLSLPFLSKDGAVSLRPLPPLPQLRRILLVDLRPILPLAEWARTPTSHTVINPSPSHP